MTPEQRVEWDAQTERLQAGLDLIDSIPESERDQATDARKEDLLALANSAIGMIMRIGMEDGMFAIGIAVQVAYALGRRDSQSIPDAFADALDNAAASSTDAADGAQS